jgi:hypothetical protein
VVISSQLQGTHYEQLAGLHLAEPRLAQQRPAAEIIEALWREFVSDQGARTGRIGVGAQTS